MESQLHNYDEPKEIIINTLVAAAEFYDGDWAGILEADLVMKVWSPLLWYNRRTKAMIPNACVLSRRIVFGPLSRSTQST